MASEKDIKLQQDLLKAEKERMMQGSMNSYQKHSYIERSRYEIQLKRYYDLFAKDKILIIKSEDFFNKTRSKWKELQRFLDIEYNQLPSIIPKENKGWAEKDPEEAEIRLLIKQELQQTYEIMKPESV